MVIKQATETELLSHPIEGVTLGQGGVFWWGAVKAGCTALAYIVLVPEREDFSLQSCPLSMR